MKELRTLVISDTHNQHFKLNIDEKDIDLIIHCGDFDNLDNFINWYGNLNIKYKVLIAGNHDYEVKTRKNDFLFLCNQLDIIYLEDSSVVIEGIKFHGTPWTPYCGGFNFMKDDFELEEKFDIIEEDVEVLISHGPPFKILDKNDSNIHCGSQTLKYKLYQLKKLRYLFCGHIHNSNGYIKFKSINCFNCSSIVNGDIKTPLNVNIKIK